MSLEEALSRLHDVLRALIGESAEEWTSQKQYTDFSSDYEWAQHLLSVHRECCQNDCCRLKTSPHENCHPFTEPPPAVRITTRVPIRNSAAHHYSASRRLATKFNQRRPGSRIKHVPMRPTYPVASTHRIRPRGPAVGLEGGPAVSSVSSTLASVRQIKREPIFHSPKSDDDDVILIDSQPLPSPAPPVVEPYPAVESWGVGRGFVTPSAEYQQDWEYDEDDDAVNEGDLSMEGDQSVDREQLVGGAVNIKSEQDESTYFEEETDQPQPSYELSDIKSEPTIEQWRAQYRMMMSRQYLKYSPVTMTQAVADVLGERMKLRDAASIHNIPLTSLWRHVEREKKARGGVTQGAGGRGASGHQGTVVGDVGGPLYRGYGEGGCNSGSIEGSGWTEGYQ